MPATSPQPKDLHIDQLLTQLSIMYINETTGFVADKVFPIVPVRKQSDKFAIYEKGQFFRNVAQKRAPGSRSTGAPYATKTDSYFCENYATHALVTDELRANADRPFDPDATATKLVVNWLLLAREVVFASDFFKDSVWETDLTGTAGSGTPPAPGPGQFLYWSDYVNSDPIGDIDRARDTAYATTATELDQLLISRAVWTKLKHHPDLIERIKYTQRGVLNLDLVADLLDLRRILVAKTIQVTSAPGASTDTFAPIFGKHALLYYAPDNPMLNTPSAGYTFTWQPMGGLSYVRRLRLEPEMTDMIEGHTFFDQKQVSKDCGVFFKNAIAS